MAIYLLATDSVCGNSAEDTSDAGCHNSLVELATSANQVGNVFYALPCTGNQAEKRIKTCLPSP